MNVFLTGATGFIGGSVASVLRSAGHVVVGLIHPDQRAEEPAIRERGIEPVFGVLDDAPLLARLANGCDAVVNAANVDHRGSTEAIVGALKNSGKVYIQTSGSGITADMAAGEASAAVYEDDTPVVPLPARAARVALNGYVQSVAAEGIRTAVIAPPMIYGRGTGMNSESIQIPAMIRAARKHGVAVYVGRGENRWSNVHIEDLADLFLMVLERGRSGAFYYAENGENSMREIAMALSRTLGFGERTKSLSVPEAIREYGEAMTHLSFGSNSRVRATRAHGELGWTRRRLTLLDEIDRGCYVEHAAHATS